MGIFSGIIQWFNTPFSYVESTAEPGNKSLLDDFVVIDVETTGLSEYKDKVIQVAAVRYINHKISKRFVSYVNPGRSIPREASRINGITSSTVRTAPKFEQIKYKYFDFIEQSPLVVGYNVRFDLKFLCSESGLDLYEKWNYLDVLSCTREAIPTLPGYKLSEVCHYIGYKANFHDALADCCACGEVLNYLHRKGLLENSSELQFCESAIINKEQRRLARQKQEERWKEYEEQQKAYLAEKEERKAKEPSRSELYQVSAQMTGNPVEYLNKVYDILVANGVEPSDITVDPARCILCYKDGLEWYFFGVKLSGKLRYINLYLPPKMVTCDYICTMEAQTMGPGYCRIYVPSPEALDSISQYIVKAFNHAKEQYKRWR